MKIILFILIFFCAGVSSSFGRTSGWVPIPSQPDKMFLDTQKKSSKKAGKKSGGAVPRNNDPVYESMTVYDNQPPVTEAEILSFVELLPKFRNWARQRGEEAHPVVSPSGQPDFVYSKSASEWIRQHNFNTRRFFCIMGKLAAGMVIVTEGNDYGGMRPTDMPEVSKGELELVSRHLGVLLKAGKTVTQTNPVVN